MNNDFWNERYGVQEYAYGEEPNEYLKEKLEDCKGKSYTMLFPAEGEGRNAVYAARLCNEVTCFDLSEEGKKKALQLADKHGAAINYQIDSYESFNSTKQFDMVVLIFAHVPPNKRKEYYQKCIQWLKPGGKMIVEGFAKDQIELNSGGPKNIDMLYSIEEVKSDFEGLEFEELEEKTVHLNEGPFHEGEARVIRFVGVKK